MCSQPQATLTIQTKWSEVVSLAITRARMATKAWIKWYWHPLVGQAFLRALSCRQVLATDLAWVNQRARSCRLPCNWACTARSLKTRSSLARSGAIDALRWAMRVLSYLLRLEHSISLKRAKLPSSACRASAAAAVTTFSSQLQIRWWKTWTMTAAWAKSALPRFSMSHAISNCFAVSHQASESAVIHQLLFCVLNTWGMFWQNESRFWPLNSQSVRIG